MPNRMLHESLLTSEQINGLTVFEEVCFTRLLLCADDYGHTDGRPAVLAAQMFPLRREVGDGDVARAVDALCAAGLLARYEVQGRPYLALTGWERRQKLRYRRTGHPLPVEAHAHGDTRARVIAFREEGEVEGEAEGEGQEKEKTGDTQSAPAAVVGDAVGRAAGEGGPAVDGSLALEQGPPCAGPLEGDGEGFTPPTLAEVADYVHGKGFGINPARFVDFYTSKGWLVGASPMRSWKAAVNIWQGNLAADRAAETRLAGRALRIVPGGAGALPGNPFEEAGL